MQAGIVGLGRMGGNMAARWRDHGHEVLGYSRTSPDRDADSLEELVGKLSAPRVVWLMLPSGEPTRQSLRRLADLLTPGDVIVEGGNSRFSDDTEHEAGPRRGPADDSAQGPSARGRRRPVTTFDTHANMLDDKHPSFGQVTNHQSDLWPERREVWISSFTVAASHASSSICCSQYRIWFRRFACQDIRRSV
ncbi:NAD(P)-binding domain-containing protein [Streptomyces sp. NBC_00289]